MTKKKEKQEYQIEQKVVEIVAEPIACPCCGSTERTRLKEISPRLYNDIGCIVRYRTKCLGEVTPIGLDGNPILDDEGKPKTFCCGRKYMVRKRILGLKPKKNAEN